MVSLIWSLPEYKVHEIVDFFFLVYFVFHVSIIVYNIYLQNKN